MPDEEPAPYPYAIAMRGKNPAVLAVELLNPYNGIDATDNERHLIRDVHGQPLRRGVLVDSIYDIGRIENVHFNPWWSMKPRLFAWQQQTRRGFHLRAERLAIRLQHVLLSATTSATNSSRPKRECATATSSASAPTTVSPRSKSSNRAPMALLISNGEFVSFHGPDPTMVEVGTNHSGSVRFVNCAFWGPCRQIARVGGRGTVGFSDCTFVQWDNKKEGLAGVACRGRIPDRAGLRFSGGQAPHTPGRTSPQGHHQRQSDQQ